MQHLGSHLYLEKYKNLAFNLDFLFLDQNPCLGQCRIKIAS